jgi:hypothetical protein
MLLIDLDLRVQHAELSRGSDLYLLERHHPAVQYHHDGTSHHDEHRFLVEHPPRDLPDDHCHPEKSIEIDIESRLLAPYILSRH